MHSKDLLLITRSSAKQAALKVQQLLHSKGITATIVTPSFIQPLDFELFSQQLSTHRFVATLEEQPTSMGMMINNFLIQNSIQAAENLHFCIPDMWVQFGSNTELMRESGMDAESITRRILQELFADDYRFISKREQKAFV